MTDRARLAIGALAVVVAVLAFALIASLVMDGEMHDDSGYMGMASAMHDGNMNDFTASMRQAMSDEDFATMQAHMQAHQAGSPMIDDGALNQMMHRMMDGMMSGMMDGMMSGMMNGPAQSQ